MKKILLSILLLSLFASTGFARQFRVSQVPNGNKNNCATCHTGFGGPRNDFGQMIESSYLDAAGSSGNVLWGPELAGMDADGDGATNGEELLDPDGAWVAGDANPGESSSVTNPGDANSVSKVADRIAGITTFALEQNYPNPFNPSTTIQFSLVENTYAELSIFNTNGNLVKTLASENMSAGTYSVSWDATDDNGSRVGSGLYFYELKTENNKEMKSMLLLR